MNSSKKACCAVETVFSGTVLSGRRSHVIHQDQQPPAVLLRARCADTKALTTNYMLHIHPTNPPVLQRLINEKDQRKRAKYSTNVESVDQLQLQRPYRHTIQQHIKSIRTRDFTGQTTNDTCYKTNI